jgi:hypothetical protein
MAIYSASSSAHGHRRRKGPDSDSFAESLMASVDGARWPSMHRSPALGQMRSDSAARIAEYSRPEISGGESDTSP